MFKLRRLKRMAAMESIDEIKEMSLGDLLESWEELIYEFDMDENEAKDIVYKRIAEEYKISEEAVRRVASFVEENNLYDYDNHGGTEQAIMFSVDLLCGFLSEIRGLL